MADKPLRSRNPVKSFDVRGAAAEAGVVLLNAALQPIAMDRGAASLIGMLSGDTSTPAKGAAPPEKLPRVILEQLRSIGPSGVSSRSMVLTAGGRRYIARASLAQSQRPSDRGPWIVLRFQRERETSDALGEVSARFHLTDRERETLSALATGMTSKEVAQQMNIAPNTVKAFLRLIKIKTGARNRADIIATLLNPQYRATQYDETVDASREDWPDRAPARQAAARERQQSDGSDGMDEVLSAIPPSVA